jgi:hypothetical protein
MGYQNRRFGKDKSIQNKCIVSPGCGRKYRFNRVDRKSSAVPIPVYFSLPQQPVKTGTGTSEVIFGTQKAGTAKLAAGNFGLR